MIIRFIGKKPELDRYSVKYQTGGENRLHFEMPVPYNNGSEYRIFLNGADVTDGFDYSAVSYVHAPIVVKRGLRTIWTSEDVWLDVVRKEDDFGGGGAMVDATLTVQGAAADAKATGEAVGKLSKEIDDLKKEENELTEISGNVVSCYPVMPSELSVVSELPYNADGYTNATLYRHGNNWIPASGWEPVQGNTLVPDGDDLVATFVSAWEAETEKPSCAVTIM